MCSRESHFAQMISLLGPPQQELLEQADSTVRSCWFDAQGTHDTALAYVAYDPQVHSKIQSLSPPQQLRLRTARLSSREKISGGLSSLHLRCFAGCQKSELTAKELYNDLWLNFKPKLQADSA